MLVRCLGVGRYGFLPFFNASVLVGLGLVGNDQWGRHQFADTRMFGQHLWSGAQVGHPDVKRLVCFRLTYSVGQSTLSGVIQVEVAFDGEEATHRACHLY